jgi:dienelactone hydrolase
MLLFLAAVLPSLAPIDITEALAIGEVSKSGRRPVPDDAIVNRIVSGSWVAPKAGDAVEFHGKSPTWHSIRAGKDGWFEDSALENGYVFAHVEVPTDEVRLLNAQGDSLVYVNGEPRAGDPYAYGYLRLPVFLHKGVNELLFVAGRGRLKAELSPMEKPIQLQSEDATLPDIITTDSGFVWASMVALNGTATTASGLKLRAVGPDGRSEICDEGAIPSLSARKLMVELPVPEIPTPGKATFTVQLFKDGVKLDEQQIEVAVKNPLDRQKRTFVSGIDGSVQYYSVLPASKPSGRNALVFTVHGAGVEAPSQTGAYQQKDWATIVAPTNRRPYGFDWEDIGVEDFQEVESIAKSTYPHDPERVNLTGHSMGGHGTWVLGTLFPDHFASIGPSSGWVSFWSYAGGWEPELGLDTEKIVRRSMNVSDTLGRVTNTLSEKVYILHGDADDNVPVQQARMMKAELQKIGHPDFQYHEQPGAGHWWGNQCVDWPPLFDMIQSARLDRDPTSIDFTTQDLNVSRSYDWLVIDDQEKRLSPSRVQATRNDDQSEITVKTENVKEFSVRSSYPNVKMNVDGQTLFAENSAGDVHLLKEGEAWKLASFKAKGIQPGRFKNVFANHFIFVVGTNGTQEENAWAANRARYDAEAFMYRGNGAVDVIRDVDLATSAKGEHNVILYGNAETNRAWHSLMGKAAIQVHEGHVEAGKRIASKTIGGLVLGIPFDNCITAAVTGTGIAGMRATDRLGLFTSGVAYPDWILVDPSAPAGLLADGFYNDEWTLDPANSAFAPLQRGSKKP